PMTPPESTIRRVTPMSWWMLRLSSATRESTENLEIQDAPSQGNYHGVRPITCIQLGQDIRHVALYGVLGDVEVGPNPPIGSTLRDAPQHQQLPWSHRTLTHVSGELRGDLGWNDALTRIDPSDRINQLGAHEILENVAGCPGFERSEHLHIPRARCQHNDP